MTDDVLLDCPMLACSAGAWLEVGVVRDVLRARRELASGGAIVLSFGSVISI